MMKKIVTFGALCALLLTSCRSAGAVHTSGSSQSDGIQQAARVQVENVDTQVITVTSRETVKVVPDMAEIVFGVTSQNADAAVCQQENQEKVNQLVEKLKELGLGETSIQTSGYDLSPRYDWQNNGQITGYEAVTQVTASDVSLDLVGNVLTQSVEAGANQIQSVSYLSSTYDESYQEALKLAVAQAQEKAQALADASGCTLGQAVHITEYSNNQTARYVAGNVMAEESDAAAAPAVVMPGEIEVEASISVDYAIQ